LPPLDFEIISKKRLFFQFRGIKTNFTAFGPPRKKFRENPLLAPPWKILPTPMVIKRAQFSCQGVIFTLHHVPLFMDGTWLLLVPIKTAVGLQLLKISVVIQRAMNRSRRVSVVNTDGSSANISLFSSRKILLLCNVLVGCGPSVS